MSKGMHICFFLCLVGGSIYPVDRFDITSQTDAIEIITGAVVKSVQEEDVALQQTRRRMVQKIAHALYSLFVHRVFRSPLHDAKVMIVDLCEELYDSLQQEGESFYHSEGLPCLHCIFLIDDKQERRDVIYKHLEYSHDSSEHFLQDLTASLFSYFTNMLDGVMTYYNNEVQRTYRRMFFKMTDECDDDTFGVEGKVFHKAATLVMDRFQTKSGAADVPKFILLIDILQKLGDMIYEPSNEELFVDLLACSIKNLSQFLSHDELYPSIKKMSPHIDCLHCMHSKSELCGATKSLLTLSVQDGSMLIEEFFTGLRICLHEKLIDAFSSFFKEAVLLVGD